MKDFNEYFDRLGCALSLGKEKVNTLVIHPMHSAYMKFKRAQDWESVKELDDGFAAVTNFLSDNQETAEMAAALTLAIFLYELRQIHRQKP